MRLHISRRGHVGVSFGWPGLLVYAIGLCFWFAIVLAAVLAVCAVVAAWALGILAVSALERTPAGYRARIAPRFQRMADKISELTHGKRTVPEQGKRR